MAFYSQQCVDCTEVTKRCAGEYHGKDEKGKSFSGSMYTCDNPACKISYERRKTERYLHSVDNGWYTSGGEERYRHKYR